MNNYQENRIGRPQLFFLVILRMVIGWHFLYEGISKLMNVNWSSHSYLMDSQGFAADVFYWMAGHPVILKCVDFINIWGLIAIGIGLICGFLTQTATWSAIILLTFYYLSHPALITAKYAVPSEGSYLIINKIIIEIAALLVLLVFRTGHIIGIDRLLGNYYCRRNKKLSE